MYGDNIPNRPEVVRNEISITNLISVANNQQLFSRLDYRTQQELIEIICAYTKACVEEIMVSENYDAKKVRENL